MNPRKRRSVETPLERKGFQKNQRDHRKFIYHMDSGEKTAVWTKTSHGSGHKDISPINLGKMAKQCKLDKNDFERLLDCPLSREDYQTQLIQDNLL
jgi:hypothetical protein